jgi:lipoprotein-anchoring transpeptidase ErfK/SrfK
VHGASSQVPLAIGLTRVRPRSDGELVNPLENCLNAAPVLRTFAALVIAAGLACAAAPASEQTRTIPAGVSIAGIRVGSLSAEPARARIDAAFARPVTIDYRSAATVVPPAAIGATLSVDAAVSSALAATPRSKIALPVRYSRLKVAKLVASLARRYNRAAVDAKVTGASASGPTFEPAHAGIAVRTTAMRAAVAQLLRDGTRTPLQLLTSAVQPKRTISHFGAVIVVTRGVNTLRFYDGRRLVRTFPVATGQAIYPTPAGVWRVANKQRNPWWYPPTYDAWAKGLKPVPPGPGNPLGTRWMGLTAPGVGIHGTDADTSIGYSASHGCIRMHVPDAEWLFERVPVGTPVVIL